MTEYDIPENAPVHRCPYCDAPFPEADLRDLHLGVDHEEDLTDEQREAVVAATETESASLNRFRIIALGVLVVLYFGLLMTYALV